MEKRSARHRCRDRQLLGSHEGGLWKWRTGLAPSQQESRAQPYSDERLDSTTARVRPPGPLGRNPAQRTPQGPAPENLGTQVSGAHLGW